MLRSPFTFLEQHYTHLELEGLSMKPPVFIIGHWRSGTTHLGNILSRSTRFGYISPFAVGLPWNFLLLGKWLRPLLESMLPADRLVDRVPVKPDSPQEDEFALANMQSISFLNGWYFPGNFESNFSMGLHFDNCSREEIDRWKQAHAYFLKKVYIDQQHKRLIVKNPAYTTRIPVLRELWPGAKFIFIHRNPLRVFKSMRKLHRNMFSALALQDYSHVDIDEYVLSTFARMMDTYIKDSASCDEDELVEVRYDELDHHPLEVIRHIYDRLNLGIFDEDREPISEYLDSISRYRKNVYEDTDQEKSMVFNRWEKYFDHWNYTMKD